MPSNSAARAKRALSEKHLLAKRWEPVIKKAAQRALRENMAEALRRPARNAPEINKALRQRWENRVYRAIEPLAIGEAAQGWLMGSKEVGREPAKAEKRVVGGVKVGDELDDFLQRGRQQDVKKWLRETSRLAARRQAAAVDRIFALAWEAWDEEALQGETPRDIADSLEELGREWDEAYSRLIARTTSTWSMNEGALQRYEEAGIKSSEWFATEDDLLCQFCAAMDGAIEPTFEPYLEAGEPLTGEPQGEEKQGTMTVPFDVTHPPLHPHCRCTLLPVFAETGG